MPKAAPRIRIPELPPIVEEQDGDVIVSYSELDTYRQCPLKHLLAYKQRWTKPAAEDSPLTKGTLWHVVMETHYGVIKAWQDAHGGKAPTAKEEAELLRAAFEAVRPLLWSSTGDQSENQVLIAWMYKGYVEHYGSDKQWRILGIEYKLQRRLLDEEGNDSVFLMKAKLDLIVMERTNGGIWIVDHKSGANLPSQFDLEIDDQFGGYTWLLQDAGMPVLGAIHSAARTTRNQADFPEYVGKSKPQTLEQRMSRTRLNRGDVECANIARDAWAVAENAHPEEGRELPLYSSPDPRQCGWKCDFKEIHLLTRAGRPMVKALEDYGFKQDFTRH